MVLGKTEDGQTIIVEGTLVFDVIDGAALMTTTDSLKTIVNDSVVTAVHDVCGQLTWEALKAEHRTGTLDRKLKNAAQIQLKDYGVKVMKLMVTSLTSCPGREGGVGMAQLVTQDKN